MAETALDRYKGEIESLKRQTARVREKANAAAAVVQRDATTVAAAAAYGALRKNGTIPGTIVGIDADVVTVGALYIAGHIAGGMAGDAAHDAAVGIASAIAYTKARS